MLDGRVNLDQAAVIVHALDDLPTDDISAEVREQAELHLISLADDFAPTELRRPARKVLEVVAPELSEEAERKALEREEQRASERTRLTVTPRGDGTNRIGGIISNATTARLMTYLEAFASPGHRLRERRRTHPHRAAPRARPHRPPRSTPR
ncbi:13E12 repeat family protein [Nocardioides sp. B-3]|uniref:13E12 repeat family protein n=1 Tax=Nocardioides sp. B-3 TaxID=2895565 RepID=UPI0021524157|nr:13E12 repeat family protein [Nocardioides sp. B-3]UUZ60236.1 13E12 repeat family protein [Nocardioides sp. B-3]